MKLKYLFVIIYSMLVWSAVVSAQETATVSLADSIDLNKAMLRMKYPHLENSKDLRFNIPTINPFLGRDGIQYNKFEDLSIAPFIAPRTKPLGVDFYGVGSDDIFSKSRTAVASYSPAKRLNLHTAATLGLVETPFFGKANYYILNAGANYLIAPNLMAGISGSYNSDFGVMPFWNISTDWHYAPSRSFLIEGSLGYTQTAANRFNINQSAVQIDLHARQRITDDWYLNAYGGKPLIQKTNTPLRPMMPIMNNTYYGATIEHWFSDTMGAEAGMIWVRDMFSGKMRPQPKLELKFRPGR